MSTSNPWLLLDRSNILSLSVSLSVPKSQTSIHHGIWSCIGQRVAFSYQEGLDFLYTAIHTRKLDNEKKTKLWRNWQWVGLVMECTLKRMLQMFGTKNWCFYPGDYLLFFLVTISIKTFDFKNLQRGDFRNLVRWFDWAQLESGKTSVAQCTVYFTCHFA